MGGNMKRIVRYDILRVVACFAIILLHVSASYWNGVDVKGKDFFIITVYNSLTRFAVPVFFMLSGLFLASPHKKDVAVGKRVLKLILLFYVWSAFFAFQRVIVIVFTGNFSQKALEDAVERFISGHYHMWFLQVLCGFYLLIPVARQLCAKKEAVQYYLILWVVFRFLFPCLTNAFHLDILQARIDSLGMDVLAGNFGYFLLGYYLKATEIKQVVRRGIYIIGIGAIFLTIFLTIRDSRAQSAYVEKWFSPSSLNILVFSVAIFIFFQYGKWFEQVKRPELWKKLSDYTFFVYMFHVFIIGNLNRVGITMIAYPSIISIPVITIFTFTGSLLCAFLADHIPVIRKIVMLH